MCSCLHTGAHKHICIQANGAFGSCWELPVYLINSTWLEAKDMQTRKGKINNRNKISPSRPPLEKKHFPVTAEAKERGGEKVSHFKVLCLKH